MAVCDDNIINIKQGSGVVLNCIYQDSGGNGLSLTGMTIECDFVNPKTGDVIISATSADNTIIITNETTGEYTIDAGVSKDWPLGEMPVDIVYSKAYVPQHTEDFILDFVKGRTTPKPPPVFTPS